MTSPTQPLGLSLAEDALRAQEALRTLIGSRLFLTVSEVAPLIPIDERGLRRAIAEGTFPGIRIGKVIRIPVAPFLALCGIEPEDSEGEPRSSPVATIPIGTTRIGRVQHDRRSG